MCDKEKLLEVVWNAEGIIYTPDVLAQWNGVVPREANLNGFMATNIGDSIVFINNCILYPGVPGTSNGDSITFGGNLGEFYKGQIIVRFANPANANPAIEIVQKFYMP